MPPSAQLSEPEDSDFEDDTDSDDGSVDLLATARQQDPKAVRAREREYDAALAERLAEEIAAGSSAATVGGGSGFCSPADEVVVAGSGRMGLKRARTSESMGAVKSFRRG